MILPPSVDGDGRLIVNGYLPHRAHPRLCSIWSSSPSDGEWKLISINVKTEPSPGQTS